MIVDLFILQVASEICVSPFFFYQFKFVRDEYGLVLFNGIFTFVGYLMPKTSFAEEQQWYYRTHCGLRGWRSRAKGKAVLPFDIWLYILVFYFTPTLACRCKALPKKVPKRIIQKKRQQQIRDEDVSFILSFIYWVQQPFHGWGSFSWIHWNGWIPQLRCQKYVNRFMHVFVLNWYFGLP